MHTSEHLSHSMALWLLGKFGGHKVSCHCFICRNLSVTERKALAEFNGHRVVSNVEGRVWCVINCNQGKDCARP